MNTTIKIALLFFVAIIMTSCISKKKYASLQMDVKQAERELEKCGESINDYMVRLSACKQEQEKLRGKINTAESKIVLKQEQIDNLKEQVKDARVQRDQQVSQVKDITVLTQEANENIEKTLSQLERKDEYIHLIQAARSKADSMNLALSANLTTVLAKGIADQDIDIKVDKTVVFVNLSDKMLFHSGSAIITGRAGDVLEKIAKIVQSRPELEVMVEGYTDNVQINRPCMQDNWDLSVKRATSVVRELQTKYGVDPNRLIAAGRGEYNALADNFTESGRSMNRRTRIIILPKLDQFYDLLNPNNIPN